VALPHTRSTFHPVWRRPPCRDTKRARGRPLNDSPIHRAPQQAPGHARGEGGGGGPPTRAASNLFIACATRRVASVAFIRMADHCNASLRIAKRSGCPSAAWQDAIAPLLARSHQGNLTLVNVGANKGYNVAEFLQRFHSPRLQPARKLTSTAWHTELLRADAYKRGVRVRFGCGLCNACRAPPPRARFNVPVDVHAVEMVRLNAQALRNLFAAFHVPGAVHHLAMSNFSGTATYRAATQVGLEHYELGKDVDKFRSESVPCATLDDFATRQLRPRQLVPAEPRGGGGGAARGDDGPRIDLLSIDAEGQDALVLEGAAELLRRRAVGVLEFEYIMRGYWRADKGRDQRLLADVLARLETFGYACYWQGESGQLAHASGAYWCEAFAFRLRANLVCAHRPDVLRILDGLCV
jgi:hypothetical protein